MSTRVAQKKTTDAGNMPKPLENVVMQVAEFDGQTYAFIQGMHRNIPDDGIAAKIIAYSSTDNVVEDTGVVGATEGYTKA